MRFAEHFSLCQTQGLLRVGHLGKRLGCALHSGDGFREGRGLATRGGIVLAGSCGWLLLRDVLAANVREGDAFFEECWGVEMKISLRESSTFARVRRVKGV